MKVVIVKQGEPQVQTGSAGPVEVNQKYLEDLFIQVVESHSRERRRREAGIEERRVRFSHD